MFKAAGSVLKRFPQRNKSGAAIVAMQVRQVARGVIDEELSDFGLEVTKKVLVKSYKFGVLTITAPSSISSLVFVNQEKILDKINDKLKSGMVKKILLRSSSSV